MIYADPPWPWTSYSQITGMDRAPIYPPMTLDAIKALDIAPSLRAIVLFLWATMPMLPQALEVMAAWGFKYKSGIPWDKGAKDRAGTGYWFRNEHELLFVGTRGDIPRLRRGRAGSLIEAPAREHSRKPMRPTS